MDDNHDDVELLRFSTCGSVDDGKSTLIGRLLYDSKSLFQDQLDALQRTAIADEGPNLANLTDGLRAEREQGITIDVAYRFVATPKRRFIIADTPGHIQYTRNMVTGASTANLALILIDARNGVIEQTKRHSYIASLLGIPRLLVCINKLDLVDYSQSAYEDIKAAYQEMAKDLSPDVQFVPISALVGDNVVEASTKMDWYDGPTVLEYLETVPIANDANLDDPRFPVQWVIRPRSDEHHDFRGYAGVVAGGVFKVGDRVLVLPSGQRSSIREIHTYDRTLEAAHPPMSVTLLLEDNIDVSRGDLIVREDNVPHLSQDVDAMVCWMSERPMRVGGRYSIKHTTHSNKVILRELKHRVDINTLSLETDVDMLKLNEIGRVTIRSQRLMCFDSYQRNRALGSFIIVDDATNATVGAGMICEPEHATATHIDEFVI